MCLLQCTRWVFRDLSAASSSALPLLQKQALPQPGTQIALLSEKHTYSTPSPLLSVHQIEETF